MLKGNRNYDLFIVYINVITYFILHISRVVMIWILIITLPAFLLILFLLPKKFEKLILTLAIKNKNEKETKERNKRKKKENTRRRIP